MVTHVGGIVGESAAAAAIAAVVVVAVVVVAIGVVIMGEAYVVAVGSRSGCTASIVCTLTYGIIVASCMVLLMSRCRSGHGRPERARLD